MFPLLILGILSKRMYFVLEFVLFFHAYLPYLLILILYNSTQFSVNHSNSCLISLCNFLSLCLSSSKRFQLFFHSFCLCLDFIASFCWCYSSFSQCVRLRISILIQFILSTFNAVGMRLFQTHTIQEFILQNIGMHPSSMNNTDENWTAFKLIAVIQLSLMITSYLRCADTANKDNNNIINRKRRLNGDRNETLDQIIS